jgi:hypothetical protein
LATVPLPSPWSPAHSSASAATVPSQPTANAPVPVPGLHGPDEPGSDRGPSTPRGPIPEIADLKAQPSAGTEGGEMGTMAGISAPEDCAVPGTGPADPEAAERDTAATGTDRTTREVAAQGPDSHRGPSAAESGTETTGDRGPTDTESGTETTGDRGPTDTESGTETTGDRGHKVPLRRKTTTKPRTKNKGKRARSRSPQTQRPVRELDESERQLVREVRPHVPALLARDGNEAITRVQLREIIRREGLMGVGNDRITFVLRELRSDDITTTRSTAR